MSGDAWCKFMAQLATLEMDSGQQWWQPIVLYIDVDHGQWMECLFMSECHLLCQNYFLELYSRSTND